MRTASEAYERRDRRSVLSTTAPKSGPTNDVKKWLDGWIKHHKEVFTTKHAALQKLVKEAAGGVIPPLDCTLVDWGLSVSIDSKLSEAQQLLAMTCVLASFNPAATPSS